MFMSMLPGLKLRCHYSFRSKQYLVFQIGPRATQGRRKVQRVARTTLFRHFPCEHCAFARACSSKHTFGPNNLPFEGTIVVETILRNLINVGFSSDRYTLPLRMPVEFLDLPGPQITDLFLGLIEGNLNR